MKRVDSIHAKSFSDETSEMRFVSVAAHRLNDDDRALERVTRRGFALRLFERFLPLVAFMSVAGFGVWSLSAPRTMAFFSDLEASLGNIFVAGELDFTLDATSWEPVGTASSMTPGTVVTRDVDVLQTGTLGFQYMLEAQNIVGSPVFCNALVLNASLHASSVYSGPIAGFMAGHYVFSDPEAWSFSAALPTSTIVAPSETCEFDFVYSASLASSSLGFGFTRVRTLHNVLNTSSSSVPVEEELAPVADSYISQNQPNANHADSDHLEVKSKKNENNRTFISFRFQLPPLSQVLFADLKLFMSHQPPTPRNIEAKRVVDPWSEYTVTWNNQPGISPSSTDVTTAPKQKNLWLSWDVTEDVKAFTSGIFSNFGWRLSDAQEDSKSTMREIFRSREDDSEVGDKNRRPALEVGFIPPLVYTDHIVINEVYSRVAKDDRGDDPENEWVELFNPTGSSVDISTWKICDASACDTLPASTTLPSLGFALISREAETWSYWNAIPTGTLKIVLNSSIGNGLSNSSDAVILRNASNTIVDAMNYQDVVLYHPYMKNVKAGNSFARIVRGYDTNQTSDWFENRSPNPGTNPSGGGIEIMRFTEEGAEVAAYAGGLVPLYDPLKDGLYSTMEEEVYEELPSFEIGEVQSVPLQVVVPPASTFTEEVVEEEGDATSTATSSEAEVLLPQNIDLPELPKTVEPSNSSDITHSDTQTDSEVKSVDGPSDALPVSETHAPNQSESVSQVEVQS